MVAIKANQPHSFGQRQPSCLPTSRPPSFLILKGAAQNAEKLIIRLKNSTLCNTAARSGVKRAINMPKLNKLPKDFDKLGPSAQLNILRRSKIPKYKVGRFFRTASQSIALTGIQRAFTSFAAGIRCCYSFCELRGDPPFPSRGRVIIERSAIFRPRQTYFNYVGYVRKSCHYLELPLTWETPEVKNCIAALKLQGGGEFRFPNSIRSEIISKIIARDARDGIFAHLPRLSFLFAMRVPSEDLLRKRAYKNDDLTGQSPMKDTSLIGLLGEPGAEFSVARFERRKNLSNGCILSRPCFRKLSSPKARKLFPGHAIWPAIAARVRPGDKLSPAFSSQKDNTTITAVLKKLEIPFAQSYASHGYGRGAAKELKEKGSQWPVVASVGEWRSLAFMGYVAIALDVARDMSKLLIERE